jgi:RNA polymerase sigma factor (sigma-70 family)
LITNHLAFAQKGARSFARRYSQGSGFDYEDFLSAAYEGLVIAARKFDPSRGLTFKTYAFKWTNGLMMKVMQRDRRENGWSYNPTATEKATGKKGIQQVARRAYETETTSAGESNDLGFEGLLPVVIEAHDERIYRAQVREAFQSFPGTERERHIVRRCLEGATFRAIGGELGVSHERVRQIFNGLQERLRQHLVPVLADHQMARTDLD